MREASDIEVRDDLIEGGSHDISLSVVEDWSLISCGTGVSTRFEGGNGSVPVSQRATRLDGVKRRARSSGEIYPANKKAECGGKHSHIREGSAINIER